MKHISVLGKVAINLLRRIYVAGSTALASFVAAAHQAQPGGQSSSPIVGGSGEPPVTVLLPGPVATNEELTRIALDYHSLWLGAAVFVGTLLYVYLVRRGHRTARVFLWILALLVVGGLVSWYGVFNDSRLTELASVYAFGIGMACIALYAIACWGFRVIGSAAPPALVVGAGAAAEDDLAAQQPLVIAIGGTGTEALLAYERARFVLGQPPAKFILLDSDQAQDQADVRTRRSELKELLTFTRGKDDLTCFKTALDEPGLQTLPEIISRSSTPDLKTFKWLFSDAWAEHDASVGAHGLPAFGTTMLLHRQSTGGFADLIAIVQDSLQGSKPIVLVGGVSGGTGPSALPAITSIVAQTKQQGHPNSRSAINVIAVPAWFEVDGNDELNDRLKRNRNAALNYFNAEPIFENPAVRLHVLQWPEPVRRPNGGLSKQPAHRHLINHVIAGTIADALFDKFRRPGPKEALSVLAPRGQGNTVEVQPEAATYAFPASPENYVTLAAYVRVVQMHRASFAALADLLESKGWGTAGKLYKPLIPPAVAALLSWSTSRKVDLNPTAVRTRVRERVAQLGALYDQCIATPVLDSVRGTPQAVAIQGNLKVPMGIAPHFLSIQSWPDYSKYVGAKTPWGVTQRVARGWTSTALTDSANNVDQGSGPIAITARAMFDALRIGIASLADRQPLQPTTSLAWLVPLKPDATHVVDHRYGTFSLGQSLTNGGERFNGTASDSNHSDFELAPPAQADSVPAALPMRKQIAAGLVSRAGTQAYDSSIELAMGMYFCMYNGGVHRKWLTATDLGPAWDIFTAAVIHEGSIVPAEIEARTLLGGEPFAMVFPDFGWTLTPNEQATVAARQWFGAFRFALNLHSPLAQTALDNFAAWLDRLPSASVKHEHKAALKRHMADRRTNGGVSTARVLANEPSIADRLLTSFYVTSAWASQKSDLSQHRAYAPVGDAGLDQFKAAEYFGLLDTKSDRTTAPHVFLVEFNDAIAFVLAIPKSLVERGLALYALPTLGITSAPNEETLRFGANFGDKKFGIRVFGSKGFEDIYAANGTEFVNREIRNPTAVLLKYGDAGLGLVPLPQRAQRVAMQAATVDLAIDFGTSNSIVIAKANGSWVDLSLTEIYRNAPPLLEHGAAWEDIYKNRQAHSAWLTLAMKDALGQSMIEAPSSLRLHREFSTLSENLSSGAYVDAVCMPESFRSDGLNPRQFENIVSGAKFAETITPKSGPAGISKIGYQEGMRSAYLKELLRPAFLALNFKGYSGLNKIVCTFPGVMDSTTVNGYVEGLKKLVDEFAASHGFNGVTISTMLEGQAAAAHLVNDQSFVKHRLNIALDLGGGTLDTFFYHMPREGEHANDACAFTWSIKWAGQMIEKLLARQEPIRRMLAELPGQGREASPLTVEQADALMPYALKDAAKCGLIKEWLAKDHGLDVRRKIRYFFDVIMDTAVRAIAVGMARSADRASIPKDVDVVLIGGAWRLFDLIATSEDKNLRDLDTFVKASLEMFGLDTRQVRDLSKGSRILEQDLPGKSMISVGALLYERSASGFQLPADVDLSGGGCAGVDMGSGWPFENSATFVAPRKATRQQVEKWVGSSGTKSFNLQKALKISLPAKFTLPGAPHTLLLDSAGVPRYLPGERTPNDAAILFVEKLVDRATQRPDGAQRDVGDAIDWPLQVFIEDVLRPGFEQ